MCVDSRTPVRSQTCYVHVALLPQAPFPSATWERGNVVPALKRWAIVGQDAATERRKRSRAGAAATAGRKNERDGLRRAGSILPSRWDFAMSSDLVPSAEAPGYYRTERGD